MGPSSTHNWGNNRTNALHKFPLNSSQENVSYFNGPGLTSISNLPRGREGEEGGEITGEFKPPSDSLQFQKQKLGTIYDSIQRENGKYLIKYNTALCS